MPYIMPKEIKGHTYYYLYECFREGGKVKNKYLAYLGKEIPQEYEKLTPGLRALATSDDTMVSNTPISTSTNNSTPHFVLFTTPNHQRGGPITKRKVKRVSRDVLLSIYHKYKDKLRAIKTDTDFVLVYTAIETENTVSNAIIKVCGKKARGGPIAGNIISVLEQEGVVYD